MNNNINFACTEDCNKLENTSNICSICHDYINKSSLCKTECNHCFHENCIKQWVLTKKSNCPNCRQEIKVLISESKNIEIEKKNIIPIRTQNKNINKYFINIYKQYQKLKNKTKSFYFLKEREKKMKELLKICKDLKIQNFERFKIILKYELYIRPDYRKENNIEYNPNVIKNCEGLRKQYNNYLENYDSKKIVSYINLLKSKVLVHEI